MSRKITVTKRNLDDPEPALDPAIMAMTPAERIELFEKLTASVYSLAPENKRGTRLPRSHWPVVKVER